MSDQSLTKIYYTFGLFYLISNTSKTYCGLASLIIYILEVSLSSIKSSFFQFFVDDSDMTHSAYLSVFRVLSKDELPGEIFEIISVWLFPIKQSFKTWVSLLPLNGMCFYPQSIALMHSFRANKDQLISAPSFWVCLELMLTSAPLSFPAKSIKQILEKTPVLDLFISLICKIACDQDECSFWLFCAVIVSLSP